jgi:hypothetical protein
MGHQLSGVVLSIDATRPIYFGQELVVVYGRERIRRLREELECIERTKSATQRHHATRQRNEDTANARCRLRQSIRNAAASRNEAKRAAKAERTKMLRSEQERRILRSNSKTIDHL